MRSRLEKRREVRRGEINWRNRFLSYHLFYKQLNERALRSFPGLKTIDTPAWEYLVSPLEINLSPKVLANATAAIRALYQVSRRKSFAQQLEPIPGITDRPTAHKSVLMAYDFHTSEDGECYLVEVNTNASGFMLCSLMEMTHQQSSVESYQPLQLLKSSFQKDLSLWGKSSPVPRIAICDEDIPRQKMYLEFLMYRDWFQAAGWEADFCEATDFTVSDLKLTDTQGRNIDFVYNRLTDFYLENPAHECMRQAFEQNLACFSPNPYEYWLLGDKQRLIQLGQKEFLEATGATIEEADAILKVVIPSFDKSSFASAEEIWSQRRQLFFKPKRSHGGKSVYRGESVSRKVFERLMADDILIQRYQPAQKVPVDDPRSVLENWKFDLRFFVYEDQVQLCAARIYQGQVTNFASHMGGFTLLRFN